MAFYQLQDRHLLVQISLFPGYILRGVEILRFELRESSRGSTIENGLIL